MIPVHRRQHPGKRYQWTPERIRDLRKRYGESQEQFAERFRVTVEAIRCWEQGKRGAVPSGPATVILDQLLVAANERDKVLAPAS